MGDLVVIPIQTAPVPDMVVENKLVLGSKIEAAMMVLGRDPQITRDGRVEGVDYNVPLEGRQCKTTGCKNVRKLKGRKDNTVKRKIYFAYCQKCLLKHRHKKAKYERKPAAELHVKTGR